MIFNQVGRRGAGGIGTTVESAAVVVAKPACPVPAAPSTSAVFATPPAHASAATTAFPAAGPGSLPATRTSQQAEPRATPRITPCDSREFVLYRGWEGEATCSRDRRGKSSGRVDGHGRTRTASYSTPGTRAGPTRPMGRGWHGPMQDLCCGLEDVRELEGVSEKRVLTESGDAGRGNDGGNSTV